MTKFGQAFLFLGLVFMALGHSVDALAMSERIRGLLSQADKAYRTNDNEKATKLSKEALDESIASNSLEGRAGALVLLGRSLKKAKSHVEAEARLAQAVPLNRQVSKPLPLIVNLTLLADSMRFNGKLELAIETIDEALELVDPLDNPAYKGDVHNTKGNILKTSLDYDEALKHYMLSMQYTLQIDDPATLAKVYKNIAFAHKKKANFDLHLSFNEKRAAVLEKMDGDKSELSKVYQELAKGYSRTSDFKKAIDYNVKSLELTRHLTDKEQLIKSYLNIASSYDEIDSVEQSLIYHKKALNLLRESGDSSRIAVELENMATVQRRLGLYAPALEHSLQALDIQENLKNEERIAKLLLNISIIYRKLSSYDSALEYAGRLLKIRETNDDANGIASASNELALIYLRLRQYKDAERNYNKTLSFGEEEIDPKYLAAAYRGLAVVAQNDDDYDKALESATQAERIYRQINSIEGAEAVNRTIGQIYEKLGQPKKAEAAYRQSLKQSRLLSNRWTEASSLIHIGGILAGKDKKQARIEILKAAEIAKEISAKSLLEQSYFELTRIEAGLSNYKAAYEYSSKAKDISSEINQEEVKRRIAELQIIRETEKHERQIETLERQSQINELELGRQSAELDILNKQKKISNLELEREKFIRTIFIGFSFAVVLALALLYNRFRFSKKSQVLLNEKNNQIASKNSKLEDLNATKDRFFSIIAHDLRGPVSSLVSLTQMLEDNFEAYSRDELKKYISTLNSSSIETHKLLDDLLGWAIVQLRNTDPVQRIHFIADICVSVENTLSSASQAKGIEIINTVDSKLPIYADRNMITTVVRNLLANSLKFSKHGGKVYVSALSDENFVTVHVVDDGIGMTDEEVDCLFQIDKKVSRLGTDGEKGTGLGLALCKDLVEKNGGIINVASKKGEGSDFYFTVPRRRKRQRKIAR